MQTLRYAVLALSVLAISSVASAQIQTGATLLFDHPAEDHADTQKYQLCVDGVSDATCKDVAVLQVGTSDTYSITLPSWVSRGNRQFQVRAVGFGDFGASAGSNVLAQRVIGKPNPPVNLQTEVP